jgi:hypothetical protein
MDFPKKLVFLCSRQFDLLSLKGKFVNLPTINASKIEPSKADKGKLILESIHGNQYLFEIERNVTEGKIGMLKPEMWDSTCLSFVSHLPKDKMMDIVVEMQEERSKNSKITLENLFAKFDPLAYHSFVFPDPVQL